MASIPPEDAFMVLFVHGAWQTPLFYRSIVEDLYRKGFSALTPHLPICNSAALSEHLDMDMAADIQVVESEIRRLVMHEGGKVLLVTHAYGGVVGTEAIGEDQSYLGVY